MLVSEERDRLTALVEELYKKAIVQFQPKYPWILVRKLPKSQHWAPDSKLVLPDSQNKPVHEGVVLRTYEPFRRWFEKTILPENNVPQHLVGHSYADCECISSSVQPGEHIVFPHYAGLPIPGLDEGDYRIVKEEDVLAILEYEPLDDLENDVFYEMSCTSDKDTVVERRVAQCIANMLRRRYFLTKAQRESLTTSGVGQSSE